MASQIYPTISVVELYKEIHGWFVKADFVTLKPLVDLAHYYKHLPGIVFQQDDIVFKGFVHFTGSYFLNIHSSTRLGIFQWLISKQQLSFTTAEKQSWLLIRQRHQECAHPGYQSAPLLWAYGTSVNSVSVVLFVHFRHNINSVLQIKFQQFFHFIENPDKFSRPLNYQHQTHDLYQMLNTVSQPLNFDWVTDEVD